MVTLLSEKPRWKAHFAIDEFPVDKLEWAHAKALKDGLWLPPDGNNDLPAPAGLRKLPVTPHNMVTIGVTPDDHREYEDNLLITAGVTRLWNLAFGLGGTTWAAATCRVCIGDGGGSAPACAAADTELVAAVNAANRWCQMVTSVPSVSTNQATFLATVPIANGAFHWFEFAIDQGAASGAVAVVAPMLNHKGVDMGTKPSTIAWAFTGNITLT